MRPQTVRSYCIWTMPWETLEMRLSGHTFMGLHVTSYSSLRPLRSERPRVSRELPEEVTDPTGITDPTGCSTFTLLPTLRTAQLHNPATLFSFGGTRKRGICEQQWHKYRHAGEVLLLCSLNGLWDWSRVRRAVLGAHGRLSWKDGASHVNTPWAASNRVIILAACNCVTALFLVHFYASGMYFIYHGIGPKQRC